MHPPATTPELAARIDYARRSADKAAQAARKLASIKVPPGFTARVVQPLPIDPVRLAVFEQAAARTRPFLDQVRATMARQSPMPEPFPEPERHNGR